MLHGPECLTTLTWLSFYILKRVNQVMGILLPQVRVLPNMFLVRVRRGLLSGVIPLADPTE